MLDSLKPTWQVAQHQRYLADETESVQDSPAPKPTKRAKKPKTTAPKALSRPSVSIPVTSAQPAPTSAPVKPQEKKRKQATKTYDKPPKAKKSKYGWVSKKHTLKHVATSEAEDVLIMEPQVTVKDAELQKVLEERMKTEYAAAPRGKGKAKVTEEQVAHDLLSLQNPKKKSPADQYIFQRRIFESAGSSLYDESPYAAGPDPGAQAEGQTGLDAGVQDEGQAGSNPDETSKGQAGPDPGNAGAEVQSIPSHVVYARLDHEHMDLDVADVSPQPSTEQLDESDKPLDANKNAETKVESVVNVSIQQDLSSISLMTSPIIDLTSRPESPKVHQQFKATTTD
nr:hypothetical protein [Tanacetum cinerariifolium]